MEYQIAAPMAVKLHLKVQPKYINCALAKNEWKKKKKKKKEENPIIHEMQGNLISIKKIISNWTLYLQLSTIVLTCNTAALKLPTQQEQETHSGCMFHSPQCRH
jgi:hypothetical protein